MPDGPARGAARRIDAVIVPAARPAGNLKPAIRTALARGCDLVVLASHRCLPAEVCLEAADLGFPASRLVLIDLGPDAVPRLPELTADRFFRRTWVPDELASAATGCPRSRAPRNTSVKRNVALELAWLLRWSTVLFLDDDVTPPHRRQLDDCLAVFEADAVAGSMGLECAPMVIGFRHEDYPDNSIVRHAGRLAGVQQQVRAGAGAFLIKLDVPPPHFPHIYNEDWLFFWDCSSRGRGGIVDGGELHQQDYPPYADPAAARWQEFGDLVAEGMRDLGPAGRPAPELFSGNAWCIAVSLRRELIRGYRDRLAAMPTSAGPVPAEIVAQAIACLDVALDTLNRNPDWATQIPQYLRAWRVDAQAWWEHLLRLRFDYRQVTDADTALVHLGLKRYRLPEVFEDRIQDRIDDLTSATPARSAALV